MKKILLIGGGGYVGSVITQHFLSLNYAVNNIDNFIYDNNNSVISFLGNKNYTFFKGKLDDISILNLASQNVDYVVILAGLVGDPITKKYPELSDSINNLGIKKCIDFFDDKKIKNLIFISTCSNYGLIKEDELADENFQLSPLSLYAKAKVSNEEYLLSKKGKVTYNGTILRFATAFGLSPRMRFDLSISEFVRDIYFNKDLEVYDENTWRPYCHVRDFSRLIETIFNSESDKIDFEIYNAGGEQNNATKKMIIDKISNHLDISKVKYQNNGTDPRNYKVSFSKAKTILNFEPLYTIEDGISELIQAFNNGFFSDCYTNLNYYGNYKIINYE